MSDDGDAASAAGAPDPALIRSAMYSRWQEPPNLWNPFWRAKLHPLKRQHVLAAGHAPTAAALGALPPGALNE